MSWEIFDASGLEFWILLAVEIQVEPVRQFNLEENPDQILSLLLRNVDDKSTETEKMIIISEESFFPCTMFLG